MNYSKAVLDRFWSKVNKTHTCWLWVASKRNADGYGSFDYNSKTVLAHRMTYEIKKGPIPNGKCVLHKCDTPLCVRPSHMFLGTHLDNSVDKIKKGRSRVLIGESNGNSKLTYQQAQWIRNQETINPKAVAERFNVSLWTVYRVTRGKSWRHVT